MTLFFLNLKIEANSNRLTLGPRSPFSPLYLPAAFESLKMKLQQFSVPPQKQALPSGGGGGGGKVPKPSTSSRR